MQQPTCTNTRIRSTQDAHKIFFAVQHGILPLVTRRLDADERLALRSGCVYAWEERGSHAEITGLGIERFTEGRRWSPSRVRDEFLFYYEKYTPPHDASHPGLNSADKPAPRDWDPLVKQTYSVWVDTPNGRRKWHLTAYFTQATVDQLNTINEIHGVGNLFVPEGLFQSTRTGKSRKADSDDSRGRSKDVFQPTTGNSSRKYAPFPTGYSGPPTPRPEMAHMSVIDDRYYQNDAPQSSSYYHPETQTLMPQFSVPPPPPPPGTHYSLPPLQTPHAGYESERRSLSNTHTDHNGVDGRYSDTPYQSGGSPQSNGYGHNAAYQAPPVHHHGHLRERFGSYPRETQAAPGGGGEASPHYDEPSWQHVAGSSSSSSYTLRPSYTSASSSHTYASSAHPSDHTGHGGHSRSGTPLSELTSPALSHSPSAREYSSSDERHVPYETTSSVRTKFPLDGDAEQSNGPSRFKLAPLHSLRNHPYRRDPVDDKALRKLRPRAP